MNHQRARLSRTFAAMIGFALAATMLTAAPANATVVAKADPTSTGTLGPALGATITRSQVLARAAEWTTQPTDYTQDFAWVDSATGGPYRIDCSGFVSMAWAATHSYVTSAAHGSPDFDTWSGKTYLGGADSASYENLLPGDALLGVSFGHIALFDKWGDSGHTEIWVYQESDSPEGSPASHDEVAKSWYINNGFRPIRYNNIVNDPPPAFDGHQMVDLNGDGLPEIIARNPANNGSLTVYPHVANNFTIAGNAWTTPITFGAGWNVYDKVMFADVNGDGLPDIIARNPTGNGSIVVYPHVPGVTTIAASSWTTAITVGTGWNIYSMITFGDINGDGYPDILAENPTGNGTLVAYPHVPGDTTIAVGMWSPGVTVGTGWNIYDTIGLADINGDGYPEILANNPTGNGTLVAYPHVANDTTIAVGMWSPAITVGSGWNIFDAINTADLNGDGLPEIMARNPAGNGTLVAYPHVAGDTTIAVGMWSPAVTIGTSWNQFGQIM